MTIIEKINAVTIPHVIPIDFRSYEDRLVCQCRESGNLTKQVSCANFLYNTHRTRCVFNKLGNGFLDYVCDVTSIGYDNVEYFNEKRRK